METESALCKVSEQVTRYSFKSFQLLQLNKIIFLMMGLTRRAVLVNLKYISGLCHILYSLDVLKYSEV